MISESTLFLKEIVVSSVSGSKEAGVIVDELRDVDDNPEELIFDKFEEILFSGNSLSYPILGTEKNIRKFFEKYCCTVRKEASFCSKLFHTILPDEFPPVDNPIKNKFHLQKEEFIKSVLIIKLGYKLFIAENPDKIKLIRKLLSKPKFAYLRINELSDIRILDMYYWFKENRENSGVPFKI